VGDALELKPVGGVFVRNRNKQVVFWLKGKDPVGQRSFALCLFRPELADDDKMRGELELAFGEVKRVAARLGLPLFDMRDFEAEMARTFTELGVGAEEYVRSRRVEDLTFNVTDLVSGRKVKLTMGMRPARPRRKRRIERP
jgi:hypothetical protein